jgi:hypothetical protein
MSTNPTEATAPATPKVKTISEDMPARRIFATPDEAAAYLNQWTECPDWEQTALAAPAVNFETGEFDPAVYTEAMNVMVSTLKNKGKVKAIVVAPVPKVSVLLDSDAGKAWVEKILNKELNHVAVRHLRDAEDVRNFIDQMPTTVDGYISSERGTGGIMETFDALYKAIDQALAAKVTAWSKARFTKGELKKALESKGYALEFYPTIEDYKGQSLFEKALQTGIIAAKRKGLDPAIFERWANTRNAKTYEPGDEDEDELDLDNLADLLDEEAEATPETAVTEQPEGEAPQAEAPATAEEPATAE